MKTLDYLKLGLLSAILILIFLDYRCCVRTNSCCKESSHARVVEGGIDLPRPANTTVQPQMSATSIIVIYDYPTSGDINEVIKPLEGVDVDVYYQDERSGTYIDDSLHHRSKATDANGEVHVRRGLGAGNFMIMAKDGKTGAQNEVRFTSSRCITDTIFIPINPNCGHKPEEPIVKEQPTVKEVTK